MVRDAPDTHERTPPHETKRAFPRRVLVALVALTVAVMLWAGLAGYILLLVLGVVIILAFFAYYVFTGAGATR